MPPNLRRQRALLRALARHLDGPPRFLRHLRTLAVLVSAITGASVLHLPRLAARIHDESHPESRIKRLTRWLANPFVTPERFYAPVARHLTERLSPHQALLIVLDASALARGCAVLLASVLYQGRALPLAWHVRRGSKGAFSTADHVALLQAVARLVPPEADVIVLGDGEFDAVDLQQAIDQQRWGYVLRTSRRTWVDDGHARYQAGDLVVADPAEEPVVVAVAAAVTQRCYGPVQVVAWQEAGHRQGLCLVTNLGTGAEAVWWYRRRFTVETLFSDQKGRGFGLDRSHVSDPARVARLLLAVSLAYVWVVVLGATALAEGWWRSVVRGDRRDVSVFTLGRRVVAWMENGGRRWRTSLSPPRLTESVR